MKSPDLPDGLHLTKSYQVMLSQNTAAAHMHPFREVDEFFLKGHVADVCPGNGQDGTQADFSG